MKQFQLTTRTLLSQQKTMFQKLEEKARVAGMTDNEITQLIHYKKESIAEGLTKEDVSVIVLLLERLQPRAVKKHKKPVHKRQNNSSRSRRRNQRNTLRR